MYNKKGFKVITGQNLNYMLSKLKVKTSDINVQFDGSTIVATAEPKQ